MKNYPCVKTTHGMIAGEWRRDVAIFRGIPYGGRVDRERRWLTAAPAEDWEGVRDCTRNGPIAVQYGTSISGSGDFGVYFSGRQPELFGCENEVQNENCLVLNVLTPGIDDKKRPVLVYIHGGGFASGSGTLVLGADPWCREEDLVVVGINHRLNVFGSLNLGAFDEKYKESGMCGMLDIVLALEWVRDNIAAFGVDPEKVTIMGESGGGGKVNMLIAMERARGLFRSAIVESGSGAPGMLSKEDAAENTRMLLKYLGIEEQDWEKLLTLPAAEILEASVKCGVGGMGFGPCADDINLFYNPDGRYIEADASRPLMVGSSEEETAAFVDPKDRFTWEEVRCDLLKEYYEAQEEAADEDDKIETTDENGNRLWSPRINRAHRKGPGTLEGVTPENVDAIIAAFRAADKENIDPQHMLLRIRSMGSRMGAGAFVQAMEKAEKKQGAVYQYLIAYDAPHPRFPEHRYAWHTADLPLQMRIVPYLECEHVSKEMAHAWAAFIRSGDPATAELDWPAFTTEERKTMVFDTVTRVEADPTKVYRDAFGG